MPALYLNGRLCNGSGRSKDEYKLSELKTIAKDNGVFIFSGSNKEDICKEIIKHTKSNALPIVIAPQIAQTKTPIVVQPVIVKEDTQAITRAAARALEVKAAANAARALEAKAAANAARALEAKAASNAARALEVKAAANAARALEAKAASNAARALEAKAAANAARALQARAAAKVVETTATTTKTRATPKPKETSNNCVKQDDKKYAERPSPPYPANECRDKIMKGNNGEMYISKPMSNGVYRWVKNK
jgi:selenocysteine-specific translation elongation factor